MLTEYIQCFFRNTEGQPAEDLVLERSHVPDSLDTRAKAYRGFCYAWGSKAGPTR